MVDKRNIDYSNLKRFPRQRESNQIPKTTIIQHAMKINQHCKRFIIMLLVMKIVVTLLT